MSVETCDPSSLSDIQRLPDEVLSHLFVVGSWLPGRLQVDGNEGWVPPNITHPPRLKPYAKLVSQVCTRWRDIIHWRSNRRELYNATISLKYTRPAGMVPVLKAYLDGLMSSEDVELDLTWRFSPTFEQGATSNRDLLVPLFLHGIDLSAPHFHRVRSLKVSLEDSDVVGFFFSLLNSLGNTSLLTHMQIYIFGNPFTRVHGPEPPFMPTCVPFQSSPSGRTFHPITAFTAPSDLRLFMNFGLMEKFKIPSNLLHLALYESLGEDSWNGLWAVILQCGSLRTLVIRLPAQIRLPDRPVDVTTINLPCLLELKVLNVSMRGMAGLLPFLVTPRLKHIHFGGEFVTEADMESERMNVAASRSRSLGRNYAESRGHAIPIFAAPLQLSICGTTSRRLSISIANLIACLRLDAVELVRIENVYIEEMYGDEDPELSRLQHNQDICLAVQTIFALFQEQTSRPHNDRVMPAVRVKLNCKLLNMTLDPTDWMINCIEVPSTE